MGPGRDQGVSNLCGLETSPGHQPTDSTLTHTQKVQNPQKGMVQTHMMLFQKVQGVVMIGPHC
eukprot:4917624-Alexandrium_andersonii.AAC.1